MGKKALPQLRKQGQCQVRPASPGGSIVQIPAWLQSTRFYDQGWRSFFTHLQAIQLHSRWTAFPVQSKKEACVWSSCLQGSARLALPHQKIKMWPIGCVASGKFLLFFGPWPPMQYNLENWTETSLWLRRLGVIQIFTPHSLRFQSLGKDLGICIFEEFPGWLSCMPCLRTTGLDDF